MSQSAGQARHALRPSSAMSTTDTPPARTGWRPPTPLLIIAGMVAFVAAAALLASMGDHKETPEPTASEVAAAIAGDPVTVHVSLTGGNAIGETTSADITLSVAGETQQFTADVPMTRKDSDAEGLDVKAMPGDFVYFSAQMKEDGASIECALTVAGQVIAHGSSSVDYGIVTCSATVPAA